MSRSRPREEPAAAEEEVAVVVTEVDTSESTTPMRKASPLLRRAKSRSTTHQEDTAQSLAVPTEATEAVNTAEEKLPTVVANSAEVRVTTVEVNTVDAESTVDVASTAAVVAREVLPVEISHGLSTSPESTEDAVRSETPTSQPPLLRQPLLPQHPLRPLLPSSNEQDAHLLRVLTPQPGTSDCFA